MKKRVISIIICAVTLCVLFAVPACAADRTEPIKALPVLQKVKDYVASQNITVRVPAGDTRARSILGAVVGNVGGNAAGGLTGRAVGAAVFPGKVIKPAADASIGAAVGTPTGAVLGQAVLPGDKVGTAAGGLTGAVLGAPEGGVLLPGDKIGAMAGRAAGAADGLMQSLVDPVPGKIGRMLGVPFGAAEGLGKSIPGLAVAEPLASIAGWKAGTLAGPLFLTPKLPAKWLGAGGNALLLTPLGSVKKAFLLPGDKIGKYAGWTVAALENAVSNFVPGTAATILSTAAGSMTGRNVGALLGLAVLPMDKILEGVWQIPAIIQGILGAEKGAVLGLALGLPSAPLGYLIGGLAGHGAGLVVGPPLGAFGGATTGGAIGAVVGYVTGFLLGIPSFSSLILGPVGAVVGYGIWAAICAPIWFGVGAFNGRAVCGILGKVVGATFGMVVEALIGGTCGYIWGRFIATIPIAVPAMLAKHLGSAIDALSGAVLGEQIGVTRGMKLGAAAAIGIAIASFIPKVLLAGFVGDFCGVLADLVLGALLTAVPAGMIGFLFGNGIDLATGALAGGIAGAALGRALTGALVVVPKVMKAQVKDVILGGMIAKALDASWSMILHGAAGAFVGRFFGTLVDMCIGSLAKALRGAALGTVLGSVLDGLVGASVLGTLFATIGTLRGFIHGLILDMASGALIGRPLVGIPSTVLGSAVGAELAKLHQKLTGEDGLDSLADPKVILTEAAPGLMHSNEPAADLEDPAAATDPADSADGANPADPLKTQVSDTEPSSEKNSAMLVTGAEPFSGRTLVEYSVAEGEGAANPGHLSDAGRSYGYAAGIANTGDVGFEIAASLLLAMAALLGMAWKKHSEIEYL